MRAPMRVAKNLCPETTVTGTLSVVLSASVSRRYAAGGLAVPMIHHGVAGGDPSRMITPAPARRAAGDQQSCRGPSGTGASSDAQYPRGPRGRARPTRCGSWPARAQPREEGRPRPQVPAVERHRVPELGPTRAGDGFDHFRPAPGRSTSPTHLLPAAATGLMLTSRPSDICITIAVTSGRTIPNRAFQTGGPSLPQG